MTFIANAAGSACRLGFRAKCFALASLLAILGTVPGSGAEASRLGNAARCPGADCAAPPVRGVTVYRGLLLDYEVIDGMAVHGGDMVLGTAAEAAAAAPSREGAEAKRSGGPARRDIAGVSSASRLWPGGRVPYEIDDAFEAEQLAGIRAAIEEWNSKTVISLFPRTDEGAYVRFAPVSEGYCRAGLGYVPDRPITVSLPPACGTVAVIHEIGHAVGLFHEHQRPDRDSFIVVPIEATRRDATIPTAWASHAGDRFTGPYDYRSVMHYWPSGGAFSIPRGIPIARTGGLSAGDIDGVARLYGEPPGTVTVATNPPGLEVLVDGEIVTAPAAFDWLPGSVHTLEAPVLGALDSRPHVFGRWNDDGDRKRTVAVADSTWFEANYIPLVRVWGEVSPPDAGTIALHPESPDGWYPRGSPVDATITAGRPPDQITFAHRMGEMSFRIDPSTDRPLLAEYLEAPLYRIDSNPAGLEFIMNGRRVTPFAFQPSQLPARMSVGVREAVPGPGSPFTAEGRYRFSGWSDGGEREHEIEVPAEGGSLTLEVQREFELVAHAGGGGEIVVSPASEDGFHPSGAQVQLTAVPAERQYFVGWEHDLAGTETTRSVIMDRDRLAVARFSAVEPVLLPFGEPVPAESLTGRHFVRVPDGTSAVAVRFESSAAVRDAAFHVTGGYRDFGSTRLRESDTITLTRETLSRMRDNARLAPSHSNHHLQVRQRGGSAWSGILHVSIQRDWIGGVWPPAFTFVSRAGWSRPLRQTLRIAPVEGELPPVRYRIVSDSHWLEAFPPEWTGAQGEAEVAVTANGAALAPEAYGGKLKIQIARGGDPAAGWTPTGIEIPVHFVVTPTDGAEEPTVDGSSGLVGGDDHGDARSAATEIAAGASARGRLEAVGDEDWFRFRTSGALTRVTAYTVSDGDTTGELHVAGSDSPVADDDSGSGGNFRIATSVPAGTHYLRISGFGTLDYALTLETMSDDHGDTREAATEIAVGASARGRLQVDGDEDWFRFETTAATTWVTAHTVSEGDTTGELHVAGGLTVADDVSGSGGKFRITAGVPAGTHYLRISGHGTVDYTLALQETLDAMEFVRIPAGSFVMGSPEDEEGHRVDETQHEVRISRDFWMGKYEVTQVEWEALMGSNPSVRNCGQCPVENVSWKDVQEFIRKLNERASGSEYMYRLPTEAEWEYAARAGTTGPRYGELDEIAWYGLNAGWRTHPVGQLRANAWGLHDMLGNVEEWTADWYGRYPTKSATDPQGPYSGSNRVLRGSKYYTGARAVRSAFRYALTPDYNNGTIGFRLVREQAGGPFGFGADDDHGDTREAATEVAVGAAAHGRLGRFDEDWFRFRTTAAQTWITAYTVSDGDTVGHLHVAGSDSPLTDDDSGGGRNFRITASVPAGMHYLRVSGFDTADYTLTLQETLDTMEFVRIPAGSFVMGSPEDEEGRSSLEGPQRKVTISQDFWMGRYEVTQEEWEAVMGKNPSRFKRCGPRCPVERVSWEDVQEFLRRLNERESGSGYAYRLPTEAEWEYAARAGTTGPRYGELDEIAWYLDNSGRKTHPVGQKRANAWGLHDMLGNVAEWVADWYGEYPSGASTDPTGPRSGSNRVPRGGSWASDAGSVRSAIRHNYYGSVVRYTFGGFRLVRTN